MASKLGIAERLEKLEASRPKPPKASDFTKRTRAGIVTDTKAFERASEDYKTELSEWKTSHEPLLKQLRTEAKIEEGKASEGESYRQSERHKLMEGISGAPTQFGAGVGATLLNRFLPGVKGGTIAQRFAPYIAEGLATGYLGYTGGEQAKTEEDAKTRDIGRLIGDTGMGWAGGSVLGGTYRAVTSEAAPKVEETAQSVKAAEATAKARHSAALAAAKREAQLVAARHKIALTKIATTQELEKAKAGKLKAQKPKAPAKRAPKVKAAMEQVQAVTPVKPAKVTPKVTMTAPVAAKVEAASAPAKPIEKLQPAPAQAVRPTRTALVAEAKKAGLGAKDIKLMTDEELIARFQKAIPGFGGRLSRLGGAKAMAAMGILSGLAAMTAGARQSYAEGRGVLPGAAEGAKQLATGIKESVKNMSVRDVAELGAEMAFPVAGGIYEAVKAARADLVAVGKNPGVYTGAALAFRQDRRMTPQKLAAAGLGRPQWGDRHEAASAGAAKIEPARVPAYHEPQPAHEAVSGYWATRHNKRVWNKFSPETLAARANLRGGS